MTPQVGTLFLVLTPQSNRGTECDECLVSPDVVELIVSIGDAEWGDCRYIKRPGSILRTVSSKFSKGFVCSEPLLTYQSSLLRPGDAPLLHR